MFNRNETSTRLVVLAMLGALVSVVAALSLVAFDRFENVPAWGAHPEEVATRIRPDGLMTQEFASALYRSLLTADDYRLMAIVADGGGSTEDKARLKRFYARYLAKARTFGIAQPQAERQFFWSASSVGGYPANSELNRGIQRRLRAAIAE